MLKSIGECLTRQESEKTQVLREVSPAFELDEKCQSDSTPGPSTTEFTDEQLVLLACQGRADAFAELMERHRATCLKRARLILHNQSDAEDEVQNAFAKAFEHLEQFRSEGSFASWLCRIVQNQCLMLIRTRREAEIVPVNVISKHGIGLELINPLPDQEEELGRQQIENLLRREISHVPKNLRNVLVLRYFQEAPVPEVAKQLCLSEQATKSRLLRARRELRSRLLKHCGNSGPRTLMSGPARNKGETRYMV